VIVLANGEYSLVRRAGVPDVAEALDERLDGLPGGYGDEDRLEAVPAFKRFGRVGPATGCGASPDGRRWVWAGL